MSMNPMQNLVFVWANFLFFFIFELQSTIIIPSNGVYKTNIGCSFIRGMVENYCTLGKIQPWPTIHLGGNDFPPFPAWAVYICVPFSCVCLDSLNMLVLTYSIICEVVFHPINHHHLHLHFISLSFHSLQKLSATTNMRRRYVLLYKVKTQYVHL